MELENNDPTAEPVSLPLGFLRSITNNFCDKRKLGEGAYGVVYKGILPCGSFIAVKVFKRKICAHQSFDNEAASLMDITHHNVVQLLGFCAESMGQTMMKQKNWKVFITEERTIMLCFEYMCNGGLDKHLSDESSGLEWNTRYKIIKGICHGLNFLHGRNIIHLDLKPENILMDATMMPKIADFGLSRLLGEQKSYTVDGTSNRPGTPGYMAPEYIVSGRISKKADIFSLGVIVIQILKGSKDDYPDYHLHTETDFQHFTEKVLSKWRKRIFEGSYTSPELHTQLVKQCIDVALRCVHHDKEKRPDVSNIIEILNAAEESCYDQNGKDLPVDHQMGTQEGLPTSGVQREDGLMAPIKIALKDHAQAWIRKDMMKSAVAPLQPQREPVLANVDGSLAALRYQGARNASFWVVHKALASLEDNALKDWAATINLGPSVEALEQELKSVKVILESTRGKVIHNLALEDILMVLRELVYDAEDVLDEMEYFRIQGEVLDASQHTEGSARNLNLNVLPSVHDYDDEPPKLRFDKDNASQRIEHIVEQMQFMLKKVSSAITLLGPDWNTAPNIAQSRPITISESTEPKLYGRELMMKSIVDDITKGKHSGEVLTVIPIVGPGGIGKTTLAQHVYHSGEVKQHFDVRVWTCVSLNFNVNKLIEEVQRYIPKVDGESTTDTASELIGERLKNRRLLLVLDDIWDCSDGDEWKRLLVPFRKSEVHGNIIIVTTRFPAQAEIMARKKDHSIYLKGIENKEFEELFLEIIFGDDDQSRKDHKFLHETGSRIAGRLKGSPLAAKTVGTLLKTQLDMVHWTRILESKEWEHSDGKNDIMPALKLSFDYLPSQLQLCFSYCALFPQDYKFERQELINFWIGQEVLHSSHGENKRVEDIGLSHLTELVNYGFLLENKGGEDERNCYIIHDLLHDKGGKDERNCYIIHDLLHELARKVSSLECLSIDSSQLRLSSLQVLPSIRHLSINIDDTSARDRLTLKNCVGDFNKLGTRVKVEKIRTLMIFGQHQGYFVKAFGDLFREAKALRLVFISRASYDVKDLLHNFYHLIHLRYLRIESPFPYKARFYHMKVLQEKIIGWLIDIFLLRDISNLLNLRHLLVRDNKHSSIVDVGRLKSLQELRRFNVKQCQGFELRQIGHLEELCGSLHINSLENVKKPEEADEAKLMLKSRLHELILEWENIGLSINDSTLDHILERLKPSRNLQKLSILGHRGSSCPSWLGMNLSLNSLKSLCLDDVAWKTFPPIGDLWLVNVPREKISISIPEKRFGNLRELKLLRLSGLKTWAVHAPCQLFPYLEVLIIMNCSQLVELSFSHSVCCRQQGKDRNDNLFPRLSDLRIKECPQLSSFPPVPWIEAPCSITIKEISSIDYLHCGNKNAIEENSSIDYLHWGNMDTDDSMTWNVLAFHKLTGLSELNILKSGFLPLRYLQMLSSLRTLSMSCSSDVFPFVEADSHVKYQFPVESLTIKKWSASGKELTQLLVYFPKLSYLHLQELEKVTGLGVNMKGQQQQSARAEDDVIVTSEEAERGLLLLPPNLQELEIRSCPELILLCYNPHDDSNEDDGGLQGTSLRTLRFYGCPKLLCSYLSSLFCSSSFPFPNSLEHLHIFGAVGTRVKLPLSNLTSLSSLSIWNCKNLSGKGLLSPLAQGHLTELRIGKTPYFFVDSELPWVYEQELPSSSSKLQELKIDDVAGFIAVPLRRNLHFSSLTSLEISKEYKVKHFTEEQEALLFVNSLEKIRFECPFLQFLPKRLHRLPNLKRLQIWSCKAIQMLPKDGLPSSLEELDIRECPKIPLPKDYLPDSLQILKIQNCPAIRSLPEVDDLPSSLREIDVRKGFYLYDRNSEELKSQCRRFINIIPIVRI